MQNLAGTGNSTAARRELLAAGIPVIDGPIYGECKVGIFGLVGRWLFTRSWYYWVARAADGSDLPTTDPDVRDFDAVWGAQVRAHGYAGGGALDLMGPTVDSYHIDTAEGLAAFARFLEARK